MDEDKILTNYLKDHLPESGEEYIYYTVSRVKKRTRRLDKYIKERWGRTSRTRIQKAIEEGRVRVNGIAPLRSAHRLQPGDEIEIYLPPRPPKYFPADLGVEIIYEDGDLLVVNKPSGMSMHPGLGHKGDTLADFLVYCRIRETSNTDSKPGIVHRLDRPTSGVVLTAKNIEGQRHIGRQFFHRKISKDYLALVWGNPPDRGEIDAPMDKCPGDRFHYITTPEGYDAFTSYYVVERYPQFSLVCAQPKTGRTHQIRVHLDSIGHPIVGDHLYGKFNLHMRGGRMPPLPTKLRLCLHARRISLLHPGTDERIELDAPLPPDFNEIIDMIRELEFDFDFNVSDFADP